MAAASLVFAENLGWFEIVWDWQKDATNCGYPGGRRVPKDLDFPYGLQESMNLKQCLSREGHGSLYNIARYSLIFFLMLFVGDFVFEIAWNLIYLGSQTQDEVWGYLTDIVWWRKAIVAIVYAAIFEFAWHRKGTTRN